MPLKYTSFRLEMITKSGQQIILDKNPQMARVKRSVVTKLSSFEIKVYASNTIQCLDANFKFWFKIIDDI